MHLIRAWLIGLLLLLLPCATAGIAAPTPAPASRLADGREIYIGFDPPIGVPLSYRYEEIITRDEAVFRQNRQTFSLEFAQRDGGYAVVVTPEPPEGSPDDDGRLAELSARPFTLILNASGEIVEMEQAQAFWDSILDMLSPLLERADTEAAREPLRRYMDMLRNMPDETRLALLTENVAPILSFSDVELVVGERLAAPIELPSPFGGTLSAEAYTTLDSVEDGEARISNHVSYPREALLGVMASFVAGIAPAGEEGARMREEAAAALENLTREDSSQYRVMIDTGLLESYRATETVEAAGAGERHRQATVTTISRID